MRMFRVFLLAGLTAGLLAWPARADFTYDVTLNTSALFNNPSQGLFTVDFGLTDGSTGDGVGNNTATISNFNLNGGSLTSGTGNPSGSVSGNLSNTLTITDGSFFNDFNQQFAPGTSLSFTLDLTSNVSPSETTTPDEFAFTVYSNGLTAQASLVTIDITGPNPSVSQSGGSLGNGAPVSAPEVTSVPEPGTLVLGLLGLASLAVVRGYQRLRRTKADLGERLV